MGTFIGRYEPIAIGAAASYDTKDEQAALFVTKVNAVTNDAGALPRVATGATAKWVGVPTVAAAGDGGVTTTYKDDTIPFLGHQHLRVTAPDVDSTADVDCTADAIDKAVFGSMTVDGAMGDTVTTSFLFHHAEDAVATLWAAAVAIDGFAYALIDAEVVKITDVNMTTHTITCSRGALSSTAETWLDNAAVYWYCGPDNTVIGLDDETVWANPASTHLVLLCGTEQMLAVSRAPVGTDTMLVTRGYDGTTAASHADNATVSHYIDEATTIIDVETGHGALLLDEAFYKFGTSGTEVIHVASISSDRITIERSQYGSAQTAPIADDTALFRLWGPETLDAALTAVNGTSGMPDFQEYGGTPLCTLRVPNLETETHIEES